MKSLIQPYVHFVVPVTCVVMASFLLLPDVVRAECKEFKIVEYEDRVEAVCVGEPLSEAQKKADLEEQKKQDREAQRLRAEEQNRQREAERAGKIQAEADAAAERKKRSTPPVTPLQPQDKGRMINLPKF
jgi:hypothetical protein